VTDLAHGLSAITGRAELLSGNASAAPRIGVVMQEFAGAPESAGEQALRTASAAAERAGAQLRRIALPEIVAEAWRVHPTLQEFEAHRALAWEFRMHHDAMPPLLRAKLDETVGLPPAAWDAARRTTNRARKALAAVFDEVDVLLTFSAPGAAPKGLSSTGDPRFNRLWTLMGVPCVNVPAIVVDGGLPVGVQVIARFGNDAGALAAARFVEEALASG
jgi:Asp-tRNA(Asn)/Glu-tRNA(Gln) amidotransferase A subunit family amidase